MQQVYGSHYDTTPFRYDSLGLHLLADYMIINSYEMLLAHARL